MGAGLAGGNALNAVSLGFMMLINLLYPNGSYPQLRAVYVYRFNARAQGYNLLYMQKKFMSTSIISILIHSSQNFLELWNSGLHIMVDWDPCTRTVVNRRILWSLQMFWSGWLWRLNEAAVMRAVRPPATGGRGP